MKEPRNKGGESAPEQPLPRHARVYVPPHSIPEQPEAATMENQTIRLDPRVDPRFALTRVDQHTIRSKRRVWWGLFFGSAAGTVLGCLIWLGVRSTAPAEARGTESSARATLGAKSVDWASLSSVDEQLRGQGTAHDADESAANASMLPSATGLADAAAQGADSEDDDDGHVEEILDGELQPDVAAATDGVPATALQAVPPPPVGGPLAAARRPASADRPSANAGRARTSQRGQAGPSASSRAAAAPSTSTTTPTRAEVSTDKPETPQNQVWVKPQEPKVWLK